MVTEYEVYKYIKEIGDYVEEPVLVAFGATQGILDNLKDYSTINVKADCNIAIANGINAYVFDANNYINVLDKEWLKPNKNLSIRIKINLADYTTGSNRTLLSKYNGYKFKLNNLDKYSLTIFDGSSDIEYISTNANVLINHSTYWLRADWNYDNGSGDSEVEFFSSTENALDSEDVNVWTSIETVSTTQHPISHSTNNMFIGGLDTSGEAIGGKFFAVEFFGENQRQMRFNLHSDAEILTADSIVRDSYFNVMSVIGNSNKFIQNTNSILYYKYIGV